MYFLKSRMIKGHQNLTTLLEFQTQKKVGGPEVGEKRGKGSKNELIRNHYVQFWYCYVVEFGMDHLFVSSRPTSFSSRNTTLVTVRTCLLLLELQP